jgi:hypothetical protein
MRRTITFALLSHCLIAVMLAIALSAQPMVASGTSPAEGATGVEAVDIDVTVVNGELRPIAGAIVEAFADAETRILGRTDVAGTIVVHVMRGTRLQAQVGTQFSASAIAAGTSVRLVVGQHVIGSVKARIAHPESRTTAQSVRALLSGDVTGGQAYVANARSAAEGGSGRQSLNGVPLDLPAPPGASSASGAIPGDLVASFDAVQADDGAYPDYHLLEPTADFRATFAAGATTFDGSQWKATATGPQRNVHYALALAGGEDEGVLAGRSMLDQSGVIYDHGSHMRHTDVSFTGNTDVGAVNISFLGFNSSRSAAYISQNKPAAVVEGIGPGNRTASDTALEFVLATWSRGRDSFSLIDGRYAGDATYDLAHALIDGIAAPSYSGYRYSGAFDTAGWTRSFGASSLSLKASTSENLAAGFSGTSISESMLGSASTQTRSDSLGLAYRIDRGAAHAGVSMTVQHVDGAFGGSFLEATAFAERRIAQTDARVSLSTTEAQSEEAGYATSTTLAPPQSASVVCTPGTATVAGPADTGTTHPRSRTLALSLSRSGNAGSIRVGAFRSDVSNALVLAGVTGVALPAAYVAGLATFFDTLCTGQTLAPGGVVVQRYESVALLRQAEAYVEATHQLGSFSIDAFYETFADLPAQTPADLAGMRTTLVAGEQLANVPLHRAGATIAYTQHATMIATGARYVSANNEANLPGHVVIDAGLRIRLVPGTVEASIQNLFGAYSGVFTSPRYALPVSTTAAPLDTLATPIQRTWTLRYTVAVGPPS